MRKAQVEIMGLAVIIVLVILGLYFIISFLISQPQQNPVEDFRKDQLAQNFVNTLVKTDTECGYSVTELIQDCVVYRNINCTGEPSCEYLNKTVNKILNNSLQEWNQPYNLTISRTGISLVYMNCTSSSEKGAQGLALVSLYGLGESAITLDVCK